MASSSSSPRIDFRHKDDLKANMRKPHDVIHHRGKYIVTNVGDHRVISINPGDVSSRVLCKDIDGLAHPCAPMEPYSIVALHSDRDEFLFTDINNGCILHLGQDKPCRKWTEMLLRRPTGIALNTQGDKVFVADCDAAAHHIVVFDVNGKYLRTFGAEDLTFPWYIAFNSRGKLYVADDAGGVKVFGPDDQLEGTLTIRTNNTNWKCRGIAIDEHDNIFVTKRTVHSLRLFSYEKVTVFSSNHNPLANHGGYFHFNFVRGVCYDHVNKLLVVVDGEWNRLRRYSLYSDDPPPTGREPELRLTTEPEADSDEDAADVGETGIRGRATIE